MNRVMWANAATQANVEILRRRGVDFLGPAEGDQACGEIGAGRMLEPLEIVAALQALCQSHGALAGKKLLVSAGPTFEDIDPVRFVGNRSSGRMGFALAAEAAAMGAQVTLVAGPVELATPANVRRIDVRSALQMRDAVLAALPGQDAYIGTAAIADFMPAQARPQKIKKGADPTMALELVRTPDVLAEVARHAGRPRVVVGLAAETHDQEANALQKLRDKNLDLIAGNDVVAPGLGFHSEENALQVYSNPGRQDIPRASKAVVARALLAMVAERLA
jgi:phosphopantothenoylcysteine decarboxylase/phosphopantothenate--cysteine ligase